CGTGRSLQVVNSSGTFQTANALSLVFAGQLSGANLTIVFDIQQIAQNLAQVTQDSQVSVSATLNSGSFRSAPQAFAFAPLSGAVGTVLTLTGMDFSSTQTVSIGGVPGTVVSQSASSLAFMAMPGTSSAQISVVTAGGTVTSPGSFTVTAT